MINFIMCINGIGQDKVYSIKCLPLCYGIRKVDIYACLVQIISN